MAWPTALVTIEEVENITAQSGLSRTTSVDLDETIKSVTEEMRDWLETNGIQDVDAIENTDSYKRPAAYLVLAKIEAPRNTNASSNYIGQYLRAMRAITARILKTEADGGTIGPVVHVNVSERDHYDADTDFFD
jgi:hypothetical protein